MSHQQASRGQEDASEQARQPARQLHAHLHAGLGNHKVRSCPSRSSGTAWSLQSGRELASAKPAAVHTASQEPSPVALLLGGPDLPRGGPHLTGWSPFTSPAWPGVAVRRRSSGSQGYRHGNNWLSWGCASGQAPFPSGKVRRQARGHSHTGRYSCLHFTQGGTEACESFATGTPGGRGQSEPQFCTAPLSTQCGGGPPGTPR